MGLCYAATALGLGTCMIGVMSQEKMHRAFHIPEDRTARLAIAVGYPAQDVPAQRKDRQAPWRRSWDITSGDPSPDG